MIYLAQPTFGDEEKRAVLGVLDSTWVTMGRYVRVFEEEFAAEHGAGAAVAVSSCSAGLHLAMLALRIGPGDEVLLPSLSFVATANAVVNAGAEPVFVDIVSPLTPLMSIKDAEKKITAKTKAIIIMHYAGIVANLNEWRRFADDHALRLIEDSAHAVGRGRGMIFGDMAAFSFYGNKNMTTGEGGMILTNNNELTVKLKTLRSHGLHFNLPNHTPEIPRYDCQYAGLNYKMDEIRAVIGIAQLKKLHLENEKRRMIAQLYTETISKMLPEVGIPCCAGALTTHHIFPVVLPEPTDVTKIATRMHEFGVQTSWHYRPIHQLSYYRDRFPKMNLNNTDIYARREITLPLHSALTGVDVEYVARMLRKSLHSTETNV